MGFIMLFNGLLVLHSITFFSLQASAGELRNQVFDVIENGVLFVIEVHLLHLLHFLGYLRIDVLEEAINRMFISLVIEVSGLKSVLMLNYSNYVPSSFHHFLTDSDILISKILNRLGHRYRGALAKDALVVLGLALNNNVRGDPEACLLVTFVNFSLSFDGHNLVMVVGVNRFLL